MVGMQGKAGGFIAKRVREVVKAEVHPSRGAWIGEQPVFLQNWGCWSGGSEGELVRKRAEPEARSLSLSCSVL